MQSSYIELTKESFYFRKNYVSFVSRKDTRGSNGGHERHWIKFVNSKDFLIFKFSNALHCVLITLSAFSVSL